MTTPTDRGEPMDSDGLTFEQLLSEAGPFMEHALKLADGSAWPSDTKRWALLLAGHMQDWHELSRQKAATIAALRQTVERLEMALMEYGEHTSECATFSVKTAPCTCGFSDLFDVYAGTSHD